MKNILYSIALLFCLVVSVVAQVPRVISYQGVLVGADGKPVNAEKRVIKFTFYDSAQNGNLIGTLKEVRHNLKNVK